MISRLLLTLVILLLPTQLGYHFWPPFSFVSGFRLDYLSPTIYLTDIFILLYIFTNIQHILIIVKKNLKLLFTLSLLFTINLLFSISPFNTLFWWIRIFEYLILALLIHRENLTLSFFTKTLTFGIIFTVCLACLQFLHQHSVGGLVYWLGERSFSSSTLFIAKIEIMGREIIRPYATFSHPNSLAGFLLLALLLLQKDRRLWLKALLVMGILISFSKMAIFVLLVLILIKVKPKIIISLSLIIAFLPLFLQNIDNFPKTVSDRLIFRQPTLSLIKQYPLFGVGLGNYIPGLSSVLPPSQQIPSRLQPVHSLPLLLITEIGLIPISILTIYLLKKIKTLKPQVLTLLLLVLLTGSVDHYWLTLPQNKLFLFIVLSIML